MNRSPLINLLLGLIWDDSRGCWVCVDYRCEPIHPRNAKSEPLGSASAWPLAGAAGPGIFAHLHWPNPRNVCCASSRDPSDGKVCLSGYKIRLSSILSVLFPQEKGNVNI